MAPERTTGGRLSGATGCRKGSGREGFLRRAEGCRDRWGCAARGSAGEGVGRGGDDTLFALVPGTVQFGTRRGRRVVTIEPVEAAV